MVQLHVGRDVFYVGESSCMCQYIPTRNTHACTKTRTHAHTHTYSRALQLKQAATPAQAKQRQTAKRLYVGNLPIGLPNIEGMLVEFVNQTMMAAGLHDPSQPGFPVGSVWLSAQQTFGFVEFRSELECTNGLNLNGVMFSGRQLRVSRPADYVDPMTGQQFVVPGQPQPQPQANANAALAALAGGGGAGLNAASLAAAAAMNPLLAQQMQQQAGQGSAVGGGAGVGDDGGGGR